MAHVQSYATESPLRRTFQDFAAEKVAFAGMVVFVLIVLAAVFAPLISPQNPYDLLEVNLQNSLMPPMSRGEDGTLFVLGTDDQGRDMLSAIFYGLRTSFIVGFGSTALSLAIGLAVGLVAAFHGGWLDNALMRIVDLQLSLPTILIALILLSVFGRGLDKVIIALVIVQWAYYARTIRSAALVERRREYVDAAICQGMSNVQIMYHHMLHNCLPPVIVVATMQIAHSIGLEATLSFLGVGVPPTEPSLGLLISKGFNYMMSGTYWISFYPGMVLFLAVVSVNLMGDRMRDVLNPRLKK